MSSRDGGRNASGFLLPILAAAGVAGVAALTFIGTSTGSSPVKDARQLKEATFSAQQQPKPDKAATDAYRGRLMGCLASHGAKVEKLPDGGYSVFLSREQANDDGEALRALQDTCQKELGYATVAPPAAN